MNTPPGPSGSPWAPSDSELRSGASLGAGRYRLVKLLGQGGMGMVWLAFDQRLGEKVALKLLPPEIRADPVALDDLRRETARSHRLAHPNIVRIHDLHEEPGEPAFISMEYVEGPNLSELRLQQPDRVLRWEMLRPLVEQLCAALEYAHGERVIHRDLKPANLMLDGRGRLKLADFGIAAVASDSLSRVSVRRPTSGTLSYMSPQQMAGQGPRATDDVYGLGATLYELLTSRPPFYTGDLTYQVREVAPQPITERLAELETANEVPSDVAALVMACLAKEPTSRPQSAGTVAAWMGLGTGSEAPQVEDAHPRPAPLVPGPIASIVIGVLLMLLGTFVSYRLRDEPRGQPGSRRSASASSARRLDPNERWTNSLGMVFAPVPNTRVMFCLWETRVRDFRAFAQDLQSYSSSGSVAWNYRNGNQPHVLKADGWKQRGWAYGWDHPGFPQTEDHPVTCVSWEDARAFCRWLTEKERRQQRLDAGQRYRLPTDVEWSGAIGLEFERGNTPADKSGKINAVYPWGAGWPPPPGAGNYAGVEARDADWPSGTVVITSYRDDYARTAPVGRFAPNRYGLYDLGGNVWEWCEDYLDTKSGLPVLRGASWFFDGGTFLLASKRGYDPPGYRIGAYGFRCVLVTGTGD